MYRSVSPPVSIQIVAVEFDDRVFLAGLRVLERVVFRIQLPVETVHIVLPDAAFVEPQPGDPPSVGRPFERPREGEFLFVCPVGDTVDDVVLPSVGGNAAFGAVREVGHEKVVVANEGHAVAVRREGGLLLRPARRKPPERSVFRIEYPVFGRERTAVHRFYVGRQQDAGFVSAEPVIRKVYRRGGCRAVENHGQPFALPVAVSDDAAAVDRRIMFAVAHTADAADGFRREQTAAQVGVVEAALGRRTGIQDKRSHRNQEK